MSGPYFDRLGAQPGVQVGFDDAPEQQGFAPDQVAAVVARLERGPIDRAFMVTREDAELRMGPARSNLVRAIHEARMQASDVLNAGAAGLVVSRLVPAGAVKRYAVVSFGGLPPPPSSANVVNIFSLSPTMEGGVLVLEVTMSGPEGNQAMPVSVVTPTQIGGRDIGTFNFDNGVDWVAGTTTNPYWTSPGVINIPPGVERFNGYLEINADQMLEGFETYSITFGSYRHDVSVTDIVDGISPDEWDIASGYAYSADITGGQGETLPLAVSSVIAELSEYFDGVGYVIPQIQGRSLVPIFVYSSPVTISSITIDHNNEYELSARIVYWDLRGNRIGLLEEPVTVQELGGGRFISSWPMQLPISVSAFAIVGAYGYPQGIPSYLQNMSIAYVDRDPVADYILAMAPALWIDPSDAATLTTAGNTVIGPTINAITDKSGNGRDLTRSSGSSSYPALRTSQLGMGGISLQSGGFNIGGDALSMSEYTVYAVVFIDSNGNLARSITFMANGQVHVGCSAALIFTSGIQGSPGLQVTSPTNYAYTQGVDDFTTGRAHVVTLKRKSNFANSELARNGTNLTVYSNGGSGGSEVFNVVGNQSSYTSANWDLGEMVVVPRITTEAEDAAAEAYLMTKWGVS